jgi:hypothetical protein
MLYIIPEYHIIDFFSITKNIYVSGQPWAVNIEDCAADKTA